MSQRRRIPSDSKLDQMIICQLKTVCDGLKIPYTGRATGNSLRKKIRTFRKNGTTQNKASQRKTIRKKVPRKKKKQISNESDESQSEDSSGNSNNTNNKNKKKSKRKKSNNSNNNGNDKNDESPPNVNYYGPPSIPHTASVFFKSRDIITSDFDCSIVQSGSIVTLSYRNKRRFASVFEKKVTAPSLIEGEMVVGEMVLRWKDKDCIVDDNLEGICQAVFDILLNQTPRGFHFVHFVDGSNEHIQYQFSRAQRSQSAQCAKQGTPLDSNQKKTIKQTLNFIDNLIADCKQLQPEDYQQLNEAKTGLYNMICDEKFYRDEYQQILNKIRKISDNVDCDLDAIRTLNSMNDNDNNIIETNTNKKISENSNNKNYSPPKERKLKTITKGKFQCKFCIQSFPSGTKLNEHTCYHHSKEANLLYCDFKKDEQECGAFFQDERQLNKHKRHTHYPATPLNIKHVGCKKNGSLTKNRFYNDNVLWKRWGMKNKTHLKFAFCVRCTGCGICWQWKEDWDYTKGNPTGRSKGNKKINE